MTEEVLCKKVEAIAELANELVKIKAEPEVSLQQKHDEFMELLCDMVQIAVGVKGLFDF